MTLNITGALAIARIPFQPFGALVFQRLETMKNYRVKRAQRCENCNNCSVVVNYLNDEFYCRTGIDGIPVSPNGICDEYKPEFTK